MPPGAWMRASTDVRIRLARATGFWTSKMGMEDLQFMGNTFVAEWTGCPEEALRKLGLTGE